MKILVGYDGSEIGKEAIKLAKIHAKAFNGEVIVFTSVFVDDVGKMKEAEQALADARQLFDDGTVPFTTEISAVGMEAGEDIIRFAQENEIDEIVISVRKRSKVGKLLFGSALQEVVLNAPCPVLVVN